MTAPEQLAALTDRWPSLNSITRERIMREAGLIKPAPSPDPEMPWGAVKMQRDATPDWTGLDELGRREFALQRLADLGQEWDNG